MNFMIVLQRKRAGLAAGLSSINLDGITPAGTGKETRFMSIRQENLEFLSSEVQQYF